MGCLDGLPRTQVLAVAEQTHHRRVDAQPTSGGNDEGEPHVVLRLAAMDDDAAVWHAQFYWQHALLLRAGHLELSGQDANVVKWGSVPMGAALVDELLQSGRAPLDLGEHPAVVGAVSRTL